MSGEDFELAAAGSGLQHASSIVADSDLTHSGLDNLRPLPKSSESHFKSLAGFVKETFVMMRKVQVVDLKSIIVSQRKWQSTSEGYQNLFEFGAIPCITCCTSGLHIVHSLYSQPPT